MAKIVKISKGYFTVGQEKKKHTLYKQDSETGLMIGRNVVPKTRSDNTKVVRLKKDFDVNRDGKIDDRDLRKGQIIGRSTGMIPSSVRVERHTREDGRKVRAHIRRR